MPYNYVSLGGARVQNDLRTMGFYSGTSTNVYVSTGASYPRGNSLGILTSGTSAASAPFLATDYFGAQLSSSTAADLYASNKGFAVYFRSLCWIFGSVTNNITYDGTQFILPTTGAVTGNYIGVSPDGFSWNFIQSVGSQTSATTTGYSIAFNGTTIISDARTGTGTYAIYGTPQTGFQRITNVWTSSVTSVRSAAKSATKVGFGTDLGIIYTATDPAGTWTPVTAFAGAVYGLCVIPDTSIWIAVGAGNRGARSPDDLQTITQFTVPTVTDAFCVAASPTAVIVVGRSGSYARSTDLGQSFTPGTFPTTPIVEGVAYGNGTWVAAAQNSAVLFYSKDDGVTWNTISSPFPTVSLYVNATALDGLKFENGRFWLCTSANSQNNYLLASSVDGVNWELVISAPAISSSGGSNSCSGFVQATNVNGSPTNVSSPVGFTPATNYTAARGIFTFYDGTNSVTTVPNGVNQWHEFQVIARPSPTVNEWNISFVIDGSEANAITTTTLKNTANGQIWFCLVRGAMYQLTSDIVYYEFPISQDPGIIGPDLRIYYDAPASDDTPKDWNPSTDGASNASQVAQPSVTNSTTFVFEDGAPKTDQYFVEQTHVPTGFRILGTRNEAYFSRRTGSPMSVTVGVVSDDTIQDLTPQSAAAPVGSWTYVKQDLPTNPDTGTDWTRATLNAAKIRIGRTS